MSGEASEAAETRAEINIDGRAAISRLFVACICIEVLFVLLDYFVNYARWTELGPIRRMFNITREDGLASWFGITQTLMAALTAWMLWLIRRSQSRAGACSRGRKVGWLIIALGLTYMTVDDGATIHERLGSSLKQIQGDAETGAGDEAAAGDIDTAAADRENAGRWWFPSYHWQVLFVPAFGALGVFMLVFLWRELGSGRQRLKVLIALSCMAMAVGLDFIEGLERNHPLNLYGRVADSLDFAAFTRARFQTGEFETLVHFSKSIEETLEMLAMTLFWVTFLTHWVRIAPRVMVNLGNARERESRPVK